MSPGTAQVRSKKNPALARGLLLALLALPTAATAQYREAGSGVEILPSRKQLLEEAVEEARWRLGALRVAPWIGLRDVSYVRGERRADGTGDDGDSDLTATAGAGLRAYLPMGKAYFAVHALPEYSWWQKQDERNAVVGRYGAGVFGFFNRLETEMTARRVEEVGFLSPDLLVRQPVRGDTFAASAQVRLGGATALYAAGELGRTRVEDPSGLTPGETSDLLDRDTTVWRGGVRYLLRGDRGHLGAGVQGEETDFLAAGEPRSNEGTGWYAEALVRGNRLSVSLDLGGRELEPVAGSSFPGYDEATGRAQLTVHPSHRLQAHVYGLRDLRYSALAVQRYFEEERLGAGVTLGLGRGSLLVFYETGENRFFGSGASTPSEDVTAYGATVSRQLGQYLALTLGSRNTRFEPQGGPEREIRELNGALSLSFGSSRGEW